MPAWNEILIEAQNQTSEKWEAWLTSSLTSALQKVSELRGGRNVVLHSSAFLQKPDVAATSIMLTHEDINGFMSVIYGMKHEKGLTLVLHTPGGVPNAAESIVAYLRTKFEDIEVIIPTIAMSAGTMVCLSADRLIMGRQSQLGPIDPQMSIGGGRNVSARAVTEQFERATREVLEDVRKAHVWAPIMQSYGPSLLQEAQNALDYSERMVADWLARYMFKDQDDPTGKGAAVAKHFNDATEHKSHGRRIDRDEARSLGVRIEDLEDNDDLQDQVLTAYHLMTMAFSQTKAVKLLWSDAGKIWQKAWSGADRSS